MGAVVLCPAHDLVERILHIQRKALVLERRQASIHRSDRRRDLRQPGQAVGRFGPGAVRDAHWLETSVNEPSSRQMPAVVTR